MTAMDRLVDTIREVADDILGLQPADADPTTLVYAIASAYHRERIALAGVEREHERLCARLEERAGLARQQ